MFFIEFFKEGDAELTAETFVGTRAKLRARVVELRRGGAKIKSVTSLDEPRRGAKQEGR